MVMNKKDLELLDNVFNLALGECPSDSIKEINDLQEKIILLDNENKKLHNLIDSLKLSELEYQDLVSYYEEETKKIEKQLDYIRSGEYYNQLRFERDMLEHVVENGKISREDKKFIDCTHRNIELLEQQREFITYLEEEIKIYSKTTYAEEILKELEEILKEYKKIIGDDK